ncbi:cyclic nucleotide-binding and patatin-like phospholipase domain-containing protein [Roseateles sp.]|uniref:patatin-like phospholipase family protein n=1 Tax=Roseateles sp. TaxID=1971397 RepID=UPI0025F05B5E|nr:cyclic nucleotide-binding and patatin-like phospholipase domain-containing protein [Roseateles sp.]MBV8036445.1 patatin-like phospholipase family protein [Roseateles sp.]
MTGGYHDRLLDELLARAFGELDAATLSLLRGQLTWVELAGGQALMRQGEAGDSMYLSVSGRLRAYVGQDGEAPRMVRELGRGHVIGEMSLYTDAPRSATVVAIRDSLLVRLDKAQFLQLIERQAGVGVALTRQIVHRLQTEHVVAPFAAPVVQAILPITAGVDVAAFAAGLAAQLGRFGRACVIDAAAVQAAVGANAAVHDREVSRWLDEVESAHDYVLLVADAAPTPWTRNCCRHADEVLLLADAAAVPAVHASETQCLVSRPPRAQSAEAAEILVLLHAADVPAPRGTAAWLARRPVAEHFHVRPALDRDMARLARLQARRGVGLVLAGGGARGFSHLGLLRALQRHGVEVDCVGGTSMGSVMAALVACDQPLPRVTDVAREAFRLNPTGDFNLLPLISLIRGRRLRASLDRALANLVGERAGIEDLWKPFYCVATNYSQASELLLTHGPLERALRASTAIPGALPPVVIDGDLLCDGGSFNNFPVDLMRARRGIGCVIGADLSLHKARKLDFDEVPGPWALLRDRLRPRGRRRYRLPALPAYLLNVTILYSSSRRRAAQAACDVYFNPPLERVGLLAWQRFDAIVEQGHTHAEEVLARPEVQALLRDHRHYRTESR